MRTTKDHIEAFLRRDEALARASTIATEDLMICATLGAYVGKRDFLLTLSKYADRCEAGGRFLRAVLAIEKLTTDTPVDRQSAIAESLYTDGRWLLYCDDRDLQPVACELMEALVVKFLKALPCEPVSTLYPNPWLTRSGYELCVQLVRQCIHFGFPAERVAQRLVEVFGDTPLARCVAFEIRRFFWYQVKAVSIDYLEAYAKAMPWYEPLPFESEVVRTTNTDLVWLATIGEPFAVEEVAARFEALGTQDAKAMATKIYGLGAKNGSPTCLAAVKRLTKALDRDR